MTQAALARAAGKSQPFISVTESGKRRLTIDEAMSWCRALDLRLSDLIRDIEDGKPLLDTPRTIIHKGRTYRLEDPS